ncbi:MAG: hypothetical protein ACKOS8_13530, partial [Gemmataceae bacterium]
MRVGEEVIERRRRPLRGQIPERALAGEDLGVAAAVAVADPAADAAVHRRPLARPGLGGVGLRRRAEGDVSGEEVGQRRRGPAAFLRAEAGERVGHRRGRMDRGGIGEVALDPA